MKKIKKLITLFIVFTFFVSTIGAATWERRIITRHIVDSYSINNCLSYNISAKAVLTFDGDTVTSASDLVFSNVIVKSSMFGYDGVVTVRQTAKRVYTSKVEYDYVLTRNVLGMQEETITDTLTYSKSSTEWQPYSLNDELEQF